VLIGPGKAGVAPQLWHGNPNALIGASAEMLISKRLQQHADWALRVKKLEQQREQSVHATNVVKTPVEGVTEKHSAIILAGTATKQIVRARVLHNQIFHVVVVLEVCRAEV
jgi:hypothetical protein